MDFTDGSFGRGNHFGKTARAISLAFGTLLLLCGRSSTSRNSQYNRYGKIRTSIDPARDRKSTTRLHEESVPRRTLVVHPNATVKFLI